MCAAVGRLKIVNGKVVTKTDAEFEADLASYERERKIKMGNIGEPKRHITIEPVTEPAGEPVPEQVPAAPAPAVEPEPVPA